jgi:hypothetical protein
MTMERLTRKEIINKADFTRAEMFAAHEFFNCGHSALCAVTKLKPEKVIPHLRNFDKKHYTNPSMMQQAIVELGYSFTRVYRCLGRGRARNPKYPEHGLVRIQFDGPWTASGVPVADRYYHTHWIAIDGEQVFDVNAIDYGGCMRMSEWQEVIVPYLFQYEPFGNSAGNGTWWPTHCWEVYLREINEF